MLDDGARAVKVQETEASLRSMFKAVYPAAVGAARDLVREVDARCGGRLIPWLEQSGAGNDLRVIAQVARHALRLKQRTAKAA